MSRAKVNPNVYKPEDDVPTRFIPSGCTLLDCILAGSNGGWAEDRIINLVGDSSTGKTLLWIEACANFARKYADGRMWAREAENAFDMPYAQGVGLPMDRVDFGPQGLETPWETVEDWIEDLNTVIAEKTTNAPGLYIVDSLDALTTRTDLERKLGEGSYRMDKPKLLSQDLFAKYKGLMRRAHICLFIISQTRDNIGVTFGEKKKRSGGDALRFYSTQEVWLSKLKTVTKTIGGSERPTGIKVRARVKKNKAGLPMRDCDFMLRFGYGVDDLVSNVEWLETEKRLNLIDVAPGQVAKFLTATEKLEDDAYRIKANEVSAVVRKAWDDIETTFLPKRKKYG